MTTLYKPVLIESAEQAEALPEGTLARRRGVGAVRMDDEWVLTTDCDPFRDHAHMIGWTALVPIEAEEGTDTIQTGAEHFYTRTRYVTPWESV